MVWPLLAGQRIYSQNSPPCRKKIARIEKCDPPDSYTFMVKYVYFDIHKEHTFFYFSHIYLFSSYDKGRKT
jgi:hypothetical protein